LTWIFARSIQRTSHVAVPLRAGSTPIHARRRVQIFASLLHQINRTLSWSNANPTNALTLVAPDIVLGTPEGILATLNSADPLAWRLGPGDTLNFTLTFGRALDCGDSQNT
jgi:hypothetical protein